MLRLFVKHYHYFTPLLIIIFSIFLRTLYWGHSEFGFDQIQILQNSGFIHLGKFTLIGPRTGPAAMFTGPLIYYISAFFRFFLPEKLILISTSISISLVTGLCFFMLTKRYFGYSKALISQFIWGLSPLIITLDRTTWNPNLTFLASLLVVLPLTQAIQGKLKKIDKFLIFFGCFLGYQAHFTGLILWPLSLLIWIILIRKDVSILTFGLLGLIISLLPTILFDLRHHFLNFTGFLTLLDSTNTHQPVSYFLKLIDIHRIAVENIGKYFVYSYSYQLKIIFGLLAIGFFIRDLLFHNNPATRLLFFWFIFSNLIFSLYPGSTPEYYYILQFPAIIILITNLLSKQSILSTLLFFLVGIFSLLTEFTALSKPCSNLCLQSQFQVTEYILHQYPQPNQVKLVYDMHSIDALSLKYLLATYQDNTATDQVHLVFPIHADDQLTSRYDALGVIETSIDPSSF